MTCPLEGHPLTMRHTNAACERLTSVLECDCGQWALMAELVPIGTPAVEDFATNLARRRIRLGENQVGMAHLLHVGKSTLGQWEMGSPTPPPDRQTQIDRDLRAIERQRVTDILTEHTGIEGAS